MLSRFFAASTPMLVQLSNVTFGYAGEDLLSGLDWQVNPGEHIGLVGPNGAGKSTLLRLLAGEIEPEAGAVARARGVSIGFLRQSQEFAGDGSIFEALLAPFGELIAKRAELEELAGRLGDGAAPADLERYGHLEEEVRRRGGYTLHARVRELAADVGFGEAELRRSVATLSGGERNRLELAKVLLAAPDLLLLDEPTNHLDLDACEKLEGVLAGYPGAFVVVSHDRALLDKVATKIVEVDDGAVSEYPGGWSRYVGERERRREQANTEYERQKEEIERLEDYVRRNIAGQKSTQAKSRRKMLERLERLAWKRDAWAEAGRIGLRFDVGDHAGGREILAAEGLVIGHAAGAPLAPPLDVTIYRGDRVGIVGPNGCGKTTLLKTLCGAERPLAGTVRRGHQVRLATFDQKLEGLDEERSLVEEIRTVRGDLSPDAVRSYLGRFRFFGDDSLRKIKGLSGGERNRLALAKMMLRPANVLALDEPTNHLDIPAREVLESALGTYEGTLVVVSHDRFFLDQICERLLVFEDGRVEQEVGNYSDWRHRCASRPPPAPPEASAAAGAARRGAGAADWERERARKAERGKLERRFRALEQEISEIESHLADLRGELARDHAGDWKRLDALVSEERELDERLGLRLAEWEEVGQQLEGDAAN